jgi:prepilin-type N-terminal cleavage/methylation domain-containing protein
VRELFLFRKTDYYLSITIMSTKSRQKGFTIVELMVTIVVAGFIIPAVAVALTNLAVTNKLSRDQALANMLIQNKVETLRSSGYNSLSISTTSFASELPNTFGSPRSATYTISTPTTGIKQIDLNISFTEYHSTRNFAYRTFISELGVGQ